MIAWYAWHSNVHAPSVTWMMCLRLAEEARKICNDLGDTRTEATCLHAYASAHDIIEQLLGHRSSRQLVCSQFAENLRGDEAHVDSRSQAIIGKLAGDHGLQGPGILSRAFSVVRATVLVKCCLRLTNSGTTSAYRQQRMRWTCTWTCRIPMLRPSSSAAWHSGS